MRADQRNIVSSAASVYARAKTLFEKTSAFFSQVTFSIKRETRAETIAEIVRKCRLDESSQAFLMQLSATKAGAAFIDEKVEEINRGAFHRSAFALNAFVQLGFVDLPAQLSVSFPQLKIALVLANVVIAALAHMEMRAGYRALLAGPKALPAKRRLGGLLANPAYNKAVKKRSRPYAKIAWMEKTLYRSAYFANAATIFFGAEFIVPPGRLIFPIGFLLGKISGLFSTAAMVFDVWRGVRASEDARIARDREVSVYRELDV